MEIRNLLTELQEQYDISVHSDVPSETSNVRIYQIVDNANQDKDIVLTTFVKGNEEGLLSIYFANNEFVDNSDKTFIDVLRAILDGRYDLRTTLTGKHRVEISNQTGERMDVVQRVNPESRKNNERLYGRFTLKG